MTNWKTTVAGLIAALGAALSGSSNPTAQNAGKLILAVGALLTGLVAKDHTN